jgi:chromate transporter
VTEDAGAGPGGGGAAAEEPLSGTSAPLPRVPFREALRVWTRVGLLSFGGPAGQIGVMHRILVEEKRWISEGRFLHALNYCMLLPGPEAQQLATYVGWLLHRVRGGLLAGTLFVLPGFLSLLALSILYARFHDLRGVEALYYGLKPAVLAIVVEAVVRIGRRALRSGALWCLAGASFISIFFLDVPFPLVVAGAGLVGLLGGRLRPSAFPQPADRAAPTDREAVVDALIESGGLQHVRPSTAGTVRTAALWLVLWFVPLLALQLALGSRSVLVQEGWFFSKAAVVTFGGAYAVLAYLAQEAVRTYGWLAPGQMLDGLGMAETTPGPLISVVQFVGFMGAYRNPGPFDPLTAGILASLVVTWVTYVPCLLWIFAGAPYIEALRGNRALGSALTAITGAVVGVILNLSVWFAVHTVFHSVGETYAGPIHLPVPDWTSLDPWSLVIGAAALVAMLRFKVGMGWTLTGAVLAGGLVRLATGGR